MDTPRTRLLLLPGLEGSGELFEGLTTELGARFETQAVRYPAAARTYDELMPIVEPSIQQSTPCIVIAESFSTPLAIHFAARARHNIRGLVLCNGFVRNPLAEFESIMATALAPWVLHLPLESVTARTVLVGPDAPESLVQAVQRAIRPVTPAVLWARLNVVFHCDARDALAQTSVPILYIHATRDRLIGGAGLREMLRIKPGIQVEQVDGPHLVLQREPRRCAEIIRRFVDTIEPARSA